MNMKESFKMRKLRMTSNQIFSQQKWINKKIFLELEWKCHIAPKVFKKKYKFFKNEKCC